MLVKKITKLIIIALVLYTSNATARLSGSLSEDAIADRLKPDAKVQLEDAGDAAAREAQAALAVSNPQAIYTKNCSVCHKTGLSGAPKLGDQKAWSARVSQGIDTLTKNAYSGIRAMPPKGNCLKCTEEDIRKTVQYMLDAIN